MSLAKKIDLKSGESIVRLVHVYSLVNWWKYGLGFVFLAAGSFWMFSLFSYGYYGYVVYGLLIVVGLYIIFRTWFFHLNNFLVITNERVVDLNRRGWFDVILSSLNFSDLKDVSVHKKGVMANMFNYGTLILESKTNQFLLEIEKVHFPAQLQTLVQELVDQYRRDRKILDVKTIFQNFVKIIPDLDDEKLTHVSELIQQEISATPEVVDEEILDDNN